jgi:hypothetical protein
MAPVRMMAVALVWTAAVSVPPASAQQHKTGPARAYGNADAIKAEELRDFLSFIASDENEGRGTPSRGLDATAQFIASHLARWNLRAAGDDGTYFQRIRLTRTRVDPSTTYADLNERRFSFGKDFIVNVFPGTFAGALVYVSHGWVIKSRNIDPYQGLDVKDRIVIVAETGLPPGVTRADLRGNQGEVWESPQPALRRRGAKAMIMIPGFGPLLEWQDRVQGSAEQGIVSVAANPVTPPLPVVRPSLAMFQALFEGESQTAIVLFNRAAAGDPAPPFSLSPSKRLTLDVGARSDSLSTQNVMAVAEGSDPTLKNEYVLISAHYDHLGVGTPVNGDSIYNGADDDGSGTAAVMTIAEAFGRGPRPKRSVLFIWHCGEERMRWGSRYFVQQPTVPLTQIVADLNLDMIGRTRTSQTDSSKWTVVHPGEIYVIGSRRLSRELGDINDAVNQSFLRLAFNYRFDAPDDPSHLFLRSDQYSYAEKGIPVIFYYGGDHEDYHQPSDTADKIDYQNMERVARTVYATAWELANRPRRPRMDNPRP